MRSVVPWILWVLLAFAASLPGAAWPPGDWYASLAKPSWTPPGIAFPIVWTTLYALMGTAAWLIWRTPEDTPGRRAALTAFGVQLALNAAWTPVFFGLHAMLAALVVIVVLWFAILATLLSARRVTPPAAALLVPYLLWVTLATALNFEIWRLNA